MEQNKRLLKSQTNKLIDCIRRRVYFSIDDFTVTEVDNHYLIVHKGERNFKFQITLPELKEASFEESLFHNTYEIVFYPYNTMQAMAFHFNDWKSVIEQFDVWLTIIYNETKGDDWWEILKNRNLGDNIDLGQLDNYTKEEKLNIKNEFEDVKRMLFEIGCGTADELQVLKEEIENLKEKVDLLNKPDFLKQIAGSLLVYLPKKISEEVLKEVIELFKEKFLNEIPMLK